MTTARIQFCLKGSGSWSYRIADQYVRLQVSKGIFRSLNSSKIHQDLSDSVCLIAENSVITQKHLLSRLELFIWPCGSESRNTVKGRVITFSSSCSLPVSEERSWGFTLNPGVSVSQGLESCAVAWIVTLQLRGFCVHWRCWGDCSLPCFLLPMILNKGFTLRDIVQCSLSDLKYCWLVITTVLLGKRNQSEE